MKRDTQNSDNEWQPVQRSLDGELGKSVDINNNSTVEKEWQGVM